MREPRLSFPLGEVFPPRGCRWGALNRYRDRSSRPDGFDHVRRAFLALSMEAR